MKIFTFLLSLVFLVGVAVAQTFSVSYAGASVVHAPVQYISDSCVKGPVNFDVEDSFALITNLSGSAINIGVIRIQNNMPAGWSNEMCLDVCYNPTVDSIGVSIPRNGSQYILLHCFTFSPHSTSGNVKLRVQNSNNPSEYSILNFSIISDSALTGITESGVPVSVSAFPNPFSSTAVINLKNYRSMHGRVPLDLIMYDLLGNSVFVKKGITQDEIIVNRNGLSSGIYFYKLMYNEMETGFGRLSIQ